MQHPGLYLASFGKDYKDLSEKLELDPLHTRLFLLGAVYLEDSEIEKIALYVGGHKIEEVRKAWEDGVNHQISLVREVDRLAREASRLLEERHEVLQKMQSLRPPKALVLSEAEFRADPGMLSRASRYIRVEVRDDKGNIMAGSGGHFNEFDSDFDWNHVTGVSPHLWGDDE